LKNSEESQSGGGRWGISPAGLLLRVRLAKSPLCLLVGGSALFGALLAEGLFSGKSLLIGLAVFVLAAGAASLNSLQEYQLDRQMIRTMRRPLPQGQLPLRQAFWQGVMLILAGLIILWVNSEGPWALLVALFAVVLYNGVYTPLKTVTVLAIVPGALCGALPPLIGWLGGGGALFSFPALLLMALLALWQVPHFWLVLLRHREDYRLLGLPSIVDQFGEARVKALFFTWIAALTTIMLMFLFLLYGSAWSIRLGVVINAVGLLLIFGWQLRPGGRGNYRLLFIVLNLALISHMTLTGIGHVVL
jgi:heme o synthase